MKIMICGSMSFSREMLKTQKALEELGHTVLVPCDIDDHLNNSDLADDLDADYKHMVNNDVFRICMEHIADSDAVLFLNYPKNGINGYVGTSSLMELGLAYYLEKRIFLMFPTPEPKEHRWAFEVKVMQPTVINGDLKQIK